MSFEMKLSKMNDSYHLSMKKPAFKIFKKEFFKKINFTEEELASFYKFAVNFNEKLVDNDFTEYKHKRKKIMLKKYIENRHYNCDIIIGKNDFTLTYAYLCYIMEGTIRDFKENGALEEVLEHNF